MASISQAAWDLCTDMFKKVLCKGFATTFCTRPSICCRVSCLPLCWSCRSSSRSYTSSRSSTITLIGGGQHQSPANCRLSQHHVQPRTPAQGIASCLIAVHKLVQLTLLTGQAHWSIGVAWLPCSSVLSAHCVGRTLVLTSTQSWVESQPTSLPVQHAPGVVHAASLRRMLRAWTLRPW